MFLIGRYLLGSTKITYNSLMKMVYSAFTDYYKVRIHFMSNFLFLLKLMKIK